MSINLNSALQKQLPESFELMSRGMYYGDGLFETIRLFKGCMPFLPLHWERLAAGMRFLGFEMPDYWSADYFKKEILKITQGNARVRINVWRSPGGYYFPTDNSPNFLITAAPLDEDVFTMNKTGLVLRQCERVRLPIDMLSGLKIGRASCRERVCMLV